MSRNRTSQRASSSGWRGAMTQATMTMMMTTTMFRQAVASPKRAQLVLG